MNLKIFLIAAICLVFDSCKKDKFVPVKVTYVVKAADSSIVNITYNSDYYFDSGNRKPVNVVSDGSFWTASHIAYEAEEYYIKVEYLSSINPETDFQVKVLFNDATTVDSVKYSSVVPVIEFSGSVTN